MRFQSATGLFMQYLNKGNIIMLEVLIKYIILEVIICKLFYIYNKIVVMRPPLQQIKKFRF